MCIFMKSYISDFLNECVFSGAAQMNFFVVLSIDTHKFWKILKNSPESDFIKHDMAKYEHLVPTFLVFKIFMLYFDDKTYPFMIVQFNTTRYC